MVSVDEHFKGKKVTLMGLGLLGRGIGDAEFFAAAGADLIVTDLKTAEELAPSMARLNRFTNITYHLGGHRMEDFENRDLIIRANNTPLDSPFIKHARGKGVPVEMDAALFAKLSPATIIGITGTRGKSTVTHMVYAMLQEAGRDPFLGGNERDVATLPLLHKTGKGDTVVLELDSWQLQGFEEAKISPHVAVWTNFMPDHMNYYKGDVERYFQDKAAIARFQQKGDYFISEQEIKQKIETKFGPLQGKFITGVTFPAGWEISLPGEHNRKNAAYVRAVGQVLSISEDIIKKSIRDFQGLPGRLELLGEKNGIFFYDDANSTTPEATMVALDALASRERPVVLIAGGSDKELDFTKLVPKIESMVKKTVLFKGAASEKMKPLFKKPTSYLNAASMEEAFKMALALAKPGDIVLLSPAATSFGIFQNEYDRGDQYRALFEELN